MGLLAFVKVWAMLRAADCRRAGVGTGPAFSSLPVLTQVLTMRLNETGQP